MSQYARQARVYGVYNATHGFISDVLECGAGQMGFHTPPVQLLKNQWDHFIKTHEPHEKFLQIIHSGGSGPVKHALLTSPESVRQRIISLAIAPSTIIPEELCY